MVRWARSLPTAGSSLLSSTSRISASRWGGLRSRTDTSVRRRVERGSERKVMMTEAAGRLVVSYEQCININDQE